MSTIIVGAGPGLGAALAMRFGQSGEPVAVISRTGESTRKLVNDATARGINIRAFQADAQSRSSLGQGLAAAMKWAGSPSVLIYNAASFNEETAETLDVEALERDFAVNVVGAVQSVQAVLPGMIARASGTILLTSGGLALNPVAAWSSLAMGKAALRAYAYSLHKSVLDRGINVATVTICGLIEAGGLFDPHRIAEEYWRLHAQPRAGFVPELVYSPEGTRLDYNDAKAD